MQCVLLAILLLAAPRGAFAQTGAFAEGSAGDRFADGPLLGH